MLVFSTMCYSVAIAMGTDNKQTIKTITQYKCPSLHLTLV